MMEILCRDSLFRERNHHYGLLNNTWIYLDLYIYLCRISSQLNHSTVTPVYIIEVNEKKCR